METLGEFRGRVSKGSKPKKYKVTNSYGIYDGYKYYRKNKPKEKEYVLTESKYFAITRAINQILADEIAWGHDVILPKAMGSIEIRKYKRQLKIGEDGKVHTNMPINWNATLELWYSDPESYKKKTLVRFESYEIFKIYYNRASATYNNNYFYEFVFHADLKKKLNQNIKKGYIDAFLLQKNIKYGE